MLILTSLVTSWLEYNDAKIPTAVSRAYADDMSSVVAGPSNAVVKDDVRKVYQNTHLFTLFQACKSTQRKPSHLEPTHLKMLSHKFKIIKPRFA
jgi:hypothetical protein